MTNHILAQIFKCDFFLCFSATDALKGEGLQEGVDWLQGKSV